MKCPLFVMTATRIARSEAPDYIECIKEECAWWVETQAECAIKQLALSLGFISLDTTQLLERISLAKK